MATTIQKFVWGTLEQWDRVDNAAKVRNVTPNHLVVEMAIEALARREWPSTAAKIQLLRSATFSAQAIARDMIASGREYKVHHIRQQMSLIASALQST